MTVNVLVIDDSQADQVAVARYLKKTGLDIKLNQAMSGEEGLSHLRKELCDCILLDYHLQDTDGLSVLKEVQNLADQSNIPTIMLTGQGDERLAVQAMRHGAYDYLSKDRLSPELLTSSVLRAIRASATQKQNRISQMISHRQQRMEALAQLTGGIAHDINNLLTVIMLNGELLEGQQQNEEDEFCLDSIVKATKQGMGITQRLLLFSKRQRLDPTTVNLPDIVEDTLILISSLLGANITIKTHVADNLWPIKVDRSELENAMMSIALNARDAMPDGGNLTFDVKNDAKFNPYLFDKDAPNRPADYVAISIKDTGCGMSNDVQQRIFDPFFTTKDIGKGTGLGLSIVYGFITQSGGYVDVSSSREEGTTFTLYFPRVSASEAAKHAPKSSGLKHKDNVVIADSKQPQQIKARILVVEDTAPLRQTICRTLRKEGYEIVEAADGPSAVAILEDKEHAAFDLMFSDVRMPNGMSGIDLAHWAREHKPDMKILLSSGYFEANDNTQKIDLPDDLEILPKPYDINHLKEKLIETLEG